MKFSILFTSISSVIGNAGQVNYAAGNTYMDSLARYRITQGGRAVSLDLGAMLRYGVLAEDESLRERLLKGSLLSGVTPAVLFGFLNYYCDPEQGLLSQDASQICLGLAQPAKLSKTVSDDPYHALNLPLYSHIIHSDKGGITDSSAGSAMIKYKAEFLAAEDVNAAGKV
jgi:hypothetical protein